MTAPLRGGGWGWEEPMPVGTRREGGGVSFMQYPTEGDIAGAGISSDQVWVGGQPTAATLHAEAIKEQQKAVDEAKFANEQRFEEILQGLSGLTDPELTRVEQGLIGRGLYGTTDLRAAKRASAERMKLQKLRFMERRTDEYPQTGQFLQLQQQLGRYGGAGQAKVTAIRDPRFYQTAAYAPRVRRL